MPTKKTAESVFDSLILAAGDARRRQHNAWRIENDEDARFFQAVEEWIESLFKASSSLRLTDELRSFQRPGMALVLEDGADPAAVMSAVPPLGRLMELHIAEGVLRHLRDSGLRRTSVLLKLLVAGPISPIAEDYLSRVARLFVAGFDPECIIIARSVLDAAMRDQVPDDLVKRGLNLDTLEVTLFNRLQLCERKALLTRATLQAAHKLRTNANDTLHVAAGIGRITAEEAISLLVSVLRELYPPPATP